MATQLDLALAQFTGFYHGKWNSNDIIGLVTSMGLTKQEWNKIKKEGLTSYLTESEITEIDLYFTSNT